MRTIYAVVYDNQYLQLSEDGIHICWTPHAGEALAFFTKDEAHVFVKTLRENADLVTNVQVVAPYHQLQVLMHGMRTVNRVEGR